jgi:hypothetical protein
VDRAIRDLEWLVAKLQASQGEGDLSVARLHSLGSQLLTYIRSNRNAIIKPKPAVTPSRVTPEKLPVSG